MIVPVAIQSFDYGTSTDRIGSGVDRLDDMFGGGLFERSLWLVAGPTGTGESMLAAHFVTGGVRAGEGALLHAFEESRDQLTRNAAAWGIDLDARHGDEQRERLPAGRGDRRAARCPPSAT